MSFTGRTPQFSQKVLNNNDFMPDISLGEFQDQYRVATDYSQDTVEQTLLLAMLEVNARLAEKQSQWQAEGTYELADVPNQPLEMGYVALYKAAVMHWAKAELLRRFPTITDRKTSDATSTHAEQNETWYRHRADQYVRQLAGQRGITCELL